ncbi:MAG: NADH-quinone oxidoreductase subunit C [Chloroflexota bacterium]
MSIAQQIVDKVKSTLPQAIEATDDFRGEQTLLIKKGQLKKVAKLMRDEFQFDFLSDIVADDMLPDFPRFLVSYHLYSIPNKYRLRLKVEVEDPDSGPETLASIWPIATWLETEVWDLMGVKFKNNKSLRRLFLPEDWQGHPLRKDYPLGYEEVQFSFNYKEIDSKKPYAKD